MNRCTAWWAQARLSASAAGILAALLAFVALLWAIRHYAQPPALAEDKIAARVKALAEVRTAEQALLHTYAVVDKTKGIYQVPIARALELTLHEWQQPAAARSNLLARVEKAAAKPPEKPSEYE